MLSLILIACHMAGDFVFQTHGMAMRKFVDHGVRSVHVTVYCICFVPAVAYAQPGFKASLLFMLWLWITHFLTDMRRWASGEHWPPKPILVDQAIHLATLAALGVLFLER